MRKRRIGPHAWVRWVGGFLVICLTLVARPLSVHSQISVGRLKAIYFERFTRFIEWPKTALPDGAPFVACIQGTGETADNLAELARARKFKDRLVEVRRVRAGSDLNTCHLLYVAGTEAPRLQQVVQAADGKAILTLGDTPGFADKGVQINLIPVGQLMNFEINMGAVKSSKLQFSSKLLRLGRLVGGNGGN